MKLGDKESVEEVGKILKKAGLIRDPRTFTIQANVMDEVKAGTYELNTSKDSKELIDIFKGKSGRCREGRHEIMITENRLTAYINSLDQGDGDLIEHIAGLR